MEVAPIFNPAAQGNAVQPRRFRIQWEPAGTPPLQQLDAPADEQMDADSGGELAPDPPGGIDPSLEVQGTPCPALKYNPLVRKRLIPNAVGIAAMQGPAGSCVSKAVAADAFSSTGDPGKSFASDCEMPSAEVECQQEDPGKQQKSRKNSLQSRDE